MFQFTVESCINCLPEIYTKIKSVQIEVSRRERVHARSYVCSYYMVPKGKIEHKWYLVDVIGVGTM